MYGEVQDIQHYCSSWERHTEGKFFLMPTLIVTFLLKFIEDCKSPEILLKGWTTEVSTYSIEEQLRLGKTVADSALSMYKE